jgi:hypothetical protein
VALTLELCQHAFPVNGTEEIIIRAPKNAKIQRWLLKFACTGCHAF